MKKTRFDNYNDGVIEFGNYEESYNIDGNAKKEKEFIFVGKLFFLYKSIREQDKLKYDHTGYKVSIKLKTRYTKNLKSSNIVKLDNKLYSIAYVEPDNKKESLYIYLTDLVDELDKHVELYIKSNNSPLQDDLWTHYRTVWGKIINLNGNEQIAQQAVNYNISKKIVIRYIEELDTCLHLNASNICKVKYKENFYNITYIENVEEENKIIELSVEVE